MKLAFAIHSMTSPSLSSCIYMYQHVFTESVRGRNHVLKDKGPCSYSVRGTTIPSWVPAGVERLEPQ